MDALPGLAAQFNLPAGLESNLRVAAGQRDNMTVLLYRLPIISLAQFPQNMLDTAAAEIRNGLGRAPVDTDLLVFGSDAPALARLSRIVEKRFQLFFFFNDSHGCEYFVDTMDGSVPFQ